METFIPLTLLIEKHGRERVAEMVGCHLTNINNVISKKRDITAVLDSDSKLIRCFEVKDFPNRTRSQSKKTKTPSCC